MRTTCGLDVHKDSVFACILHENGEKIEKKFGVLTSELKMLRNFIKDNGATETAMESTSVYWIPVWNALEGTCELKLVNPYFIKQLPGRKSDVRDAAWIAECVMKELIRGSFVPPSTIQKMRLYNRRSFDLTCEISKKLNKLDAALQRCNIRLSNYVATTDSASYKKVVAKISEGEISPETLIKEVHGRIINHYGRGRLLDALTGFITEVDIEIISQLKEEIDLARKHKEECISKLVEMCKANFSNEFEHLQTMPGVKEQSAATILAEIGADMKMFATAAALVAWCGLVPRNEESAGKIKSRRITHRNRYIRQIMIECAWAASRTKNCYYSRFNYYQTTVRHKNKMKIKVAISRKMLEGIWHILSENTDYKDYINQSKH